TMASVMFYISITASFIVCLAPIVATQDLLPPCDSEVFCHNGPDSLLHVVQMAHLYTDSKTFVDMNIKTSLEQTLNTFQQLMAETANNPTPEQVRSFVDDNFSPPGSEFVPWDPEDWNPNPEFLEKVVDPKLQEWGHDLNDLWKMLGKKISPEVDEVPERHSQIYVPHPVIVPGGRFREFYYWDSFWTMEGLLLCGMQTTVRGMLSNFMDMVNNYGLVPNGGRVYYTRRSQPPYLIPMVKIYIEATNDIEFLRENIHLLESEFNFWLTNRTITVIKSGHSYDVVQYNSQVSGPRPESYREDYETAESLPEEEKEQLYIELKSGAESGWDYSTRWFMKEGHTKGSLKDLKTTSIAPVDLNSMICMNARILSAFYDLLGDNEKEREYSDIADTRNKTIADLFWDESEGVWFDLNVDTMEKRKLFYLSNVHPLWSGCFGQEDSRANTVEKVIGYLRRNGAFDYPGGIPTSLDNSGEQWDAPNVWAPLMHVTVMGLYNARDINQEAGDLAYDVGSKWVQGNWLAYQQTSPHAMFEKYNANVSGLVGGGGEYDVQLGFGWTNGVALKFLDIFGDRMKAAPSGVK
ncbi:unnamed protein product, partial [Meganyctiphanes norvegica]